jgi:hypothetical protein
MLSRVTTRQSFTNSKGISLSRTRRLACGVGATSAALTAGILFAPAAVADQPQNSAFAIAATGLLTVDPAPAVNDLHGASGDSIAEFATPDKLIQLKLLNAWAGEAHAKASAADLRVNLSPIEALGLAKPMLTAEAIEATCEDGKGSSSLANAELGGTALDVSATPNTAVGVPGVASVILNKQTTNDDGSLTVTAISITVDGVQTLDIASATCAPAAGDDDGDGDPTNPSTTAPNEPTTPPSDNGSDDPDDGNSDNGGSGTQADENGEAPVPTPIKAHLDVTG